GGRGEQRPFGDGRARAAHRVGGFRIRGGRGDTSSQDRFGGGGRERVPALFRGDLHVEHQSAARPDRGRLVPFYSDDQPDLLPRRRTTEPRDYWMGPAGSPPGLRLCGGHHRAISGGGRGLLAGGGGPVKGGKAGGGLFP